MQHILIIIQEIFMTPALIMGGVTLIGLLFAEKAGRPGNPGNCDRGGRICAVDGRILISYSRERCESLGSCLTMISIFRG